MHHMADVVQLVYLELLPVWARSVLYRFGAQVLAHMCTTFASWLWLEVWQCEFADRFIQLRPMLETAWPEGHASFNGLA